MSIVICTFAAVFSVNAYAVMKGDPLRPPEFKIETSDLTTEKKAPAKKKGFLVREILFSGKRRVAIVNNVAVSRGDVVSGARVIDIKPTHVVLNYKDKTIKARLRTVAVKKKARQK